MKLLDGERLSNGDFILKISTSESSTIAHALIRYAYEVHPSHCKEVTDLAWQFAGLSGDH